MIPAEAVQLLIALLAAGYLYFRWIRSENDREQRLAAKQRDSAKYEVAQTGSLFVPRFDPYVEAGAVIYVPAADGMYVSRIKDERAQRYREGLRRWVAKGATINLIITRPNEAAIGEWQQLKNDFPNNFNVFLLYRENALDDATRAQIETLDTFHPVTMVAPPKSSAAPGAMWVEHLHPLGSKYAYRVDFVAPPDIHADERFNQYREFYEALLKGPHVEMLKPTKHYVPLRAA